MEKIITNFQGKYPRVVDYIQSIKKYPIKLQLEMVVHVSVLMAKLDKGYYNKYLKNKNIKLPDEAIDMFGRTYLQNYCKVCDQVYNMQGSYEPFPKLNILLPDNFVEKLINQECI